MQIFIFPCALLPTITALLALHLLPIQSTQAQSQPLNPAHVRTRTQSVAKQSESASNATTGKNPVLAGNDCARQIFNIALSPSPEAYLKVPQLITKYGYPFERHTTVSKDGYMVTIFRIPRGKKNTKTTENFPVAEAGSTRPVVLLHHGMMGSSADWFMLPESNAFPYILANAGYDVWILNARGTSYSKRHTRLNSNDWKYWQFCWHEMGKFDTPRMIDYILAKTGETKLYFIGHSMGASVFLVTMSLYPEYNDKIRSFYGLAPATYMKYMRTPLLVITPLVPILELVQNFIGWGPALPPILIPLINLFVPLICAPSPVALTFCGFWFFMIGGFDPCQFNTTQQVSKITGHAPDTTSFRAVNHYLQLRLSKEFRAYDHGLSGNNRAYGTETPPNYDLSKVTAKSAIFWGSNDLLSAPKVLDMKSYDKKDVARLVSELPNVIVNHRVAFDLWGHLDHIWGIDAKLLVYDEVMKLMAKHY